VYRVKGEWLESVYELYSYAIEHSDEIHVHDGKVRITNDTTLAEFNKRLDSSKALFDRYQKLIDQFNQQHKK
jgi:hypothetical protein